MANALCYDPPAMPLFQRPVAKRNDPLSSYVAGEKFVQSEECKNHKDWIVLKLKVFGAMTGKDIAGKTGLTFEQVARRMIELERTGLVQRIDRQGKITIWEAK